MYPDDNAPEENEFNENLILCDRSPDPEDGKWRVWFVPPYGVPGKILGVFDNADDATDFMDDVMYEDDDPLRYVEKSDGTIEYGPLKAPMILRPEDQDRAAMEAMAAYFKELEK